MRKIVLFAAFVFECATLFSAQTPVVRETQEQIDADCKIYRHTPLPVEASQMGAHKKWPDCNSPKLYSGIGVKVDFAAARRCAWSERMAIQANTEPKYTVDSVLGGPAMLAVLYANGEGVDRNIPLALRFACEAGGAPAEIELRVSHLEALRKETTSPASEFRFCDDITSGFMEGFCAAYNQDLSDQGRTNSLHKLVSSWPDEQRQKFEGLVRTQEAYAAAHGRGEVDLSGTGRAAFEIEAEEDLRDSFLAALKSIEEGDLPKGNAAEFAKADARLNHLYGEEISCAEKHKREYGAIQPEGIRATERAWLRYRDAWIGFAKLRYPFVSAQAWLTLLTVDRISVLEGITCESDFD